MATDNYGFIELDPNEKFSLVNDFNQLAQQIDAALKTIANAETENANKIATLNTNLEATNTKIDAGLSSVNMNVQTLTENVGVLREDIIEQQLNGDYTAYKVPDSQLQTGMESHLTVQKSVNNAYFFIYGTLVFSPGTYNKILIPGTTDNKGILLIPSFTEPSTTYRSYGSLGFMFNNGGQRTNSITLIIGTDGGLYWEYGNPSTVQFTTTTVFAFIQSKLTLTKLNIEPDENADNS